MATVDPRIVAALGAQLRSWRADLDRGARRVGWKAGYGIAEVEALLGDAPVPGHLTTATQLAPGAAHSAAGAEALHADAELVVEVGETVAPLSVALELVDLAVAPGDMEAIVAGNVLHRAFVLGPPSAGPPGDATLTVNGEVRARAAATADHAATVHAIGRLLEAAGERLAPGDRILTGSVVQIAIAPGDRVVAKIAGIGRADARIVP
jgi:2-keto-4-pentenoate hydratase